MEVSSQLHRGDTSWRNLLMQPMDFAPAVLERLPLAEAVLLLWQWQCTPRALDDLFEAHRGACYTKELTFATLVALIADALLEHDGSARQSFQRARAGRVDRLPAGRLRQIGP